MLLKFKVIHQVQGQISVTRIVYLDLLLIGSALQLFEDGVKCLIICVYVNRAFCMEAG